MHLHHELVRFYFLFYYFSGVSEKGELRFSFVFLTLSCHGDSILMRPLGRVYRGQSVLTVSFLRRWGWGAHRNQQGSPRPQLRALSQPPSPVTSKWEGASSKRERGLGPCCCRVGGQRRQGMKRSKKKWIPERSREPERMSRDLCGLAWSFSLRALSPSESFSVLGLAGTCLSGVGLGGRGEEKGRNP